MRRVLSIAIICIAASAQAQVAVTTLSPNIPPGDYTGYSVPANFSTVVVETSERTSLVYFAVNGSIPGTDLFPGTIYFNERTCSATPCAPTWKYPVSKPVLSFLNSSVSVSDVLFDATRPFFNDQTGLFYPYLMYMVVQPNACADGTFDPAPHIAGFLALSFSHDGEHWWSDLNGNVEPMLAHRIGGPSFPCMAAQDTVPVEAFSAVLDNTSGFLFGFGIEGNAGDLGDPANFNRTMTGIGASSPSDPRHFYYLGEMSAAGLFQNNAPSCTSHKYFINLSAAFEPTTGKLWISRAYPYPYDAAGISDVPCNSACLKGLVTFPNRVQTLTMTIGSLMSWPILTTGSWTVVNDLGPATGYPIAQAGCSGGGNCVPQPIYAPQQSIGMFAESINFRRKGDGTLAYTPTLGASNIELELSGTSNYDYTCMTPKALYDTQSRQLLLSGGSGSKYQGYVDSASCATRVVGWAWNANSPANTISVDVLIDGVNKGTFAANVYRSDLQAAGIGNGQHGYDISLPAIHDGLSHAVRVVVNGSSVDLGLSPRTITCP